MSDEKTATATKSIESVHLVLMTRFSRSRNDVMAVFAHMFAECAWASQALSTLTFSFGANGFRHLGLARWRKRRELISLVLRLSLFQLKGFC